MKILVLGAGKMGSFFLDVLSFDHETAVYEKDPKRMRFTYNCQRFTTLDEIRAFQPQLVINAVYVSTHPMFGPTFANLGQLSEENAIIISEGDYMGRIFFKDLYARLGLNIYEYTFEEHDKTVAYSLSTPFVSTFVFSAVMKHQDAPGTTFKRHLRIAKGVLGEDDYLLQEILFNPYTSAQVEQIRDELNELINIIDEKDADRMKAYLTKIRNNVRQDIEQM